MENKRDVVADVVEQYYKHRKEFTDPIEDKLATMLSLEDFKAAMAVIDKELLAAYIAGIELGATEIEE